MNEPTPTRGPAHQPPPLGEPQPSKPLDKDPLPEQPGSDIKRTLLIVVFVLLVAGFVALHLTGVIGPGSH